jgi:hypothetical protein
MAGESDFQGTYLLLPCNLQVIFIYIDVSLSVGLIPSSADVSMMSSADTIPHDRLNCKLHADPPTYSAGVLISVRFVIDFLYQQLTCSLKTNCL